MPTDIKNAALDELDKLKAKVQIVQIIILYVII